MIITLSAQLENMTKNVNKSSTNHPINLILTTLVTSLLLLTFLQFLFLLLCAVLKSL